MNLSIQVSEEIPYDSLELEYGGKSDNIEISEGDEMFDLLQPQVKMEQEGRQILFILIYRQIDVLFILIYRQRDVLFILIQIDRCIISIDIQRDRCIIYIDIQIENDLIDR